MPNLRYMYPSLRPRVKCLSGSMALAGSRRVHVVRKYSLRGFIRVVMANDFVHIPLY